MKHHFSDFLDREGQYWTMVPNADRFIYTIDKISEDKESIKTITTGKGDMQWQQIFEFPDLEELTLHEPSKEQLKSITELSQLKRLRITHARPDNIDFIAALVNLEEVVFEYVSGFSDLSPFNNLNKIKSLHFENLRRVNDFGGLKGLDSLKYLYIDGTLDWNQPIDNFTFLEGLPNLEVFSLGWITNRSDYPALASIVNLKKLKKISIIRNTFPTKEYAFLEVALPGVQGASWDLWWEYGGWLDFLGKRAGKMKCNNTDLKKKCEEFSHKYEEMKKEAEALIKTLRQIKSD